MSKVILALSFGKPADITPNWLIARKALRLSNMNYPIASDRCIPLEDSNLIHFIGKEAEIHVSTFRLIEEFVNLMEENGWDEVEIVSEPSYSKRCRRDLEKIAQQKGQHCYISLAKFCSYSNAWFDYHSTQWWIRSRILFLLREMILQALPWWLYKFISR